MANAEERPAFVNTGDTLRAMYRTMLRIRLFEERAAELLEAREIHCPTHLYIGQEAVATGVCMALNPKDLVWGNHRSHGHYLAKGGDMNALMAELLCRATGCSNGRGGSMHVIAKNVGILGTVPMVAGTIPISVGAALSSVLRGLDQVSVAFFGDGATEEGVFHESINFAALKKLPVVFVCENNLFSSHLRLRERRPVESLFQFGAAYGISGVRVDGNDVTAVHNVAVSAVDRARAGAGPTLIEAVTYRWRGHVGPSWDLGIGIREKDEVDEWMAKCPIKRLHEQLLGAGEVTETYLDMVRDEVTAEVSAAVEFARRSPYPQPELMTHHVFASENEV